MLRGKKQRASGASERSEENPRHSAAWQHAVSTAIEHGSKCLL